MVAYEKKKFRFKEFLPGKFPKKYYAVLENKITKKLVQVPFGDQRYEQYKDSTGLGLYSEKNHLDKKRRKNYRARHQHDNLKDWSSGYFSWKFLW